jgi:hypothetical protein
VKRLVQVALVAGLVLQGTGCTIHYLADVTDSPTGNMTMVQTNDVLWPFVQFAKHRYWECTEEDGSLVCKRTCDTKNEAGEKILCPFSATGM